MLILSLEFKCLQLMKLKVLFLSICWFVMIRPSLTMISIHFKCRSGIYPRSTVKRFPVPDEKVSWSTTFKEYDPPFYTSPSIRGKPWADPEIGNFNPKWNELDGNVSRISHMGEYQIVNGYSLNPIGRTGIAGRGVLGRWGPNHAADPIVTRWKKMNNEDIADERILQFVAIKRGDTGEWALPGGMVDPGEKVTTAAVREFQEEAINSLLMTEGEREAWMKTFQSFFESGDEVYRGYVDDPRNTDNAWMETVAYNFHDDDGSVVGALALHAGDDAVGVRWVDITPDIELYASHKHLVLEVLRRRTQ